MSTEASEPKSEQTAAKAASLPVPCDCDTLMSVLANEQRRAILRVLCDGEGYGVGDLAGIVKTVPSNISRHLGILKNAGVVVMGRGKLYRILPHFIAEPGQKVLEFGHCRIRLDM